MQARNNLLHFGIYALNASAISGLQEFGLDLKSWQAQGHDFGTLSAAWPQVEER
jgi:hypothetical protein